jgi:hypothetical protein
MVDYRQKIYSKAFENGVNYAIQKMFGEEEDKKKKEYLPYAASSAAGSAIGVGVTHRKGLIDQGKNTYKATKSAADKLGISIEELANGMQEGKYMDAAREIGEDVNKRGVKYAKRSPFVLAGSALVGSGAGLAAAHGVKKLIEKKRNKEKD